MLPRDEKLAGVEKLKSHGARLGEVAAAGVEGGPDFLGGARLVVRGAGHDEGHAARAVALVGDLLEHDPRQLAGALLDGAVDVVGRHVGLAGLEDQRAQPGVAVEVAAAGLGGHRDVAREPGENLAAARVGHGLEPFDFGPLIMAGHLTS